MKSIRIGTRGSPLALAQAEWVKQSLTAKTPQLTIIVRVIKTLGDQHNTRSLSEMGGKGAFVKEIEEALLKNEIDLAVHSLKDVPYQLSDGLGLGPYPLRSDNRDAIILRGMRRLFNLPDGACLGTSSPRRQAQMNYRYHRKYKIEPIRGNLESRIRKLKEGLYDGILVAAAGLKRLGLIDQAAEIFDPDTFLPAPGQGCLGLEYRLSDTGMRGLLDTICDHDSDVTARAERSFLTHLAGSCLLPIGAYASIRGEELYMTAAVWDKQGHQEVKVVKMGGLNRPEDLGKIVAEQIKTEGQAVL